jgi:hypothetical protein
MWFSRIIVLVTLLSVAVTTLDRVHPGCTRASKAAAVDAAVHAHHGSDLPTDHGACNHPSGPGAPGDCAALAHCLMAGPLSRMTEVSFVPAERTRPMPPAATMPAGWGHRPEPPPPKA